MKILITLAALVITVLGGLAALGYVPGRQSYWDAQVKEMCAKDGGVQIFERLHVSNSDIEALGRVGGKIGIPAKELAHPKAPAYEELKITSLNAGNPQVTRSEMLVVRRIDQAVIARAIIYARSGGDFPSPAHPSSFSCPDFKTVLSDFQKLFIVKGD